MAAVAPLIAATTALPQILIEEKKRAPRPKKSRAKIPNTQNQSNRRGRKGKSRGSMPTQSRSSRNPNMARTNLRFGANGVSPQELKNFRAMCENAIGKLSGNSTSSVFGRATVAGASLSFNFAHLAQKQVDRSFKNGVRVTITDVDGNDDLSSGVGRLLVCGGNSTQTIEPFAGSSASGVNVMRVSISPLTMSALTYVLAQVFESYAYRYARFRYKPTVGAYTTSSINTNVSIALGIITDPDSAAYPGTAATTTFKTIKELETSTSCHVSDSCELEYAFTGTETFSCNSSDQNDEKYQAGIVAAFDSTPSLGGTNSTRGSTYGHIEQFLVIDFYGIRKPSTGIPAFLSVRGDDVDYKSPPAPAVSQTPRVRSASQPPKK